MQSNTMTLGHVALAIAALMAFAGTASATTLTSPAGTAYTNTVTMSAETTEFHAGDSKSFLSFACHSSHVEWKVEQHGAGVTTKGKASKFAFSNCTNGVWTSASPGSLEVHATGGGNGTLTSTGAELLIHTSSGPTCTMKTNATQIGTITGSGSGQAILDINSAILPLSGFLCPSTMVWTGKYTLTPWPLEVD